MLSLILCGLTYTITWPILVGAAFRGGGIRKLGDCYKFDVYRTRLLSLQFSSGYLTTLIIPNGNSMCSYWEVWFYSFALKMGALVSNDDLVASHLSWQTSNES